MEGLFFYSERAVNRSPALFADFLDGFSVGAPSGQGELPHQTVIPCGSEFAAQSALSALGYLLWTDLNIVALRQDSVAIPLRHHEVLRLLLGRGERLKHSKGILAIQARGCCGAE